MPYKPTGNPPGRPRKNPVPDVPAKPEPDETAQPGWLGPIPAHICGECWPDGWDELVTSRACRHGIWTRRL